MRGQSVAVTIYPSPPFSSSAWDPVDVAAPRLSGYPLVKGTSQAASARNGLTSRNFYKLIVSSR